MNPSHPDTAVPTVTTIIPCHNAAETLGRAAASALAQPHLDELLIVDDASADDSLAVAQRLRADDPRVTVIGLATNSGPALARNIGAAAARGSVLCFLDADDEHLPDYYAFIQSTLFTHPRWAGTKTGCEIVGLPAPLTCTDDDPRYDATLYSAPWNLAVRKAVFWLIGGFPVDGAFRGDLGGEDVALNMALTRHYELGFTPHKYCRHYSAAGSHLERYLRRTSVVDGQIVHTSLLPEERTDSTAWRAALDRYLARAADNRSRFGGDGGSAAQA